MSSDTCPGALACPGFAKVMAEPKASPARRLTAAPQVTYIMNDLIRAGINVNPDAITIAEAKESILSHFKRNAKA